MKPRERISPMIDQARRLARRDDDQPIDAERIERDMILLAFIITSTGQTKLAPLLDRLERELAEYRLERDPLSRAQRILTSQMQPTGLVREGGNK